MGRHLFSFQNYYAAGLPYIMAVAADRLQIESGHLSPRLLTINAGTGRRTFGISGQMLSFPSQ
jgi:hypothetical protein